MLLDFEEYRSEYNPIGRAISWREGILLSLIFHLVMTIVVLVAPRYLPDSSVEARRRAAELLEQRQPPPRFVFVAPRVELKAPRLPPPQAEASDRDRVARTIERPPNPQNSLPFSRGNTPEQVESQRSASPRGQGPAPQPQAGQQNPQAPQQARAESQTPKIPDSASTLQVPTTRTPQAQAPQGAGGRAATPGGALGQALENLQRYVQRDTFDNQQGGTGEFGPAIQFDTKGVEFGPWIRRFIAQIKRNWLIPYAAMSMKGHVVVTFNVHKNGAITDLTVIGPCPVDAFNNAAFGALMASNPTTPLPPEYPSDKAFFTVTFFYNETPQ